MKKQYNSPPNFGMLVLFCIEAEFCIQIRILQHFSRSTRFANLCTAPDSKFQSKIVQLFSKMNNELQLHTSTVIRIFHFIFWILSFSKNFGEIPTKFRQNLASKRQNSIEKCRKLNNSLFIFEKSWTVFN